jgi:uncharacterized membrane protein
MELIFFFALAAATVAIAYYSVYFFDPPKASWPKAIALFLALRLCGLLVSYSGLRMTTTLYLGLCLVGVSALVWLLFRLKPFHNVVVAALVVFGSALLLGL